MSDFSRIRVPRHLFVLWGLTALAAVLRFATLDLQSFWTDEVATVDLLHLPLSSMLRAIPDSEGTPPVYYVLAWGWTHVFGTGEVGVRSLSAIAGVAAVPVFYGAAAELCSRRVGLAVAALAAVNPILIWYSQEARAYSLLVLLAGLSVWTFARLLRRPSHRGTLGWAIASALAMGTHYFAGFLVAGEAAWLIAARRTRRYAALPVACLAVLGLVLIPLAAEQQHQGAGVWITASGSLPYRAARSVKQGLLGYDSPLEDTLTVVAVGLALAGSVIAVRAGNREDGRGVRVAGTLAIAAVGLPLLLALAGRDYVDVRNLLAGWLPLAIVVAGGFVARRVGRVGVAALVALCLIQASAAIGVFVEPTWQREDWRGSAAALGTSREPRALVIQPRGGIGAMELYRPGTRVIPEAGATVREVDFVTTVVRSGAGTHPDPPPRVGPPRLPGFRMVDARYTDSYTLIRMRANAPRTLSPDQLGALALNQNAATGVLIIPGAR